MTHADWLWEILDWLSLPVLAGVAGILVWRKLHREFRFFFWYLVITDIATGVRFVAQFQGRRTYFYAYWISDLVVTVFNVLAVYELFARRLFPRFHKVRLYRYLFPIVASGIIFLSWLTALEAPNKAAALAIEDRVLDFVLAAMLAFFVSLMMVMGRTWTKYDFGIAFGFGINSAAFLVTSAMWVRTHYRPTSVDQLPLIAYDASSLIWLYCFWTGDKVSGGSDSLPLDPVMLEQGRKWETVLKDWITPGKRVP
jgi:hypothetical protein